MGDILEKRTYIAEAFSWAVNTLIFLLYQDCILIYFAKLSVTTLISKKTQFKNFPRALYATDVIFQQANCPSGKGTWNLKIPRNGGTVTHVMLFLVTTLPPQQLTLQLYQRGLIRDCATVVIPALSWTVTVSLM